MKRKFLLFLTLAVLLATACLFTSCDFDIASPGTTTTATTTTTTTTAPTTTLPDCQHHWGSTTVLTEPTCARKGYCICYCENCPETKIVELGPTGEHSWDTGRITTTPTCAVPGVRTFTCTKCPATRTEAEPTVQHSWNSGEITTPPQEGVEGVRTFHCLDCPATKTESIAPLPPKTDISGSIIFSNKETYYTGNFISIAVYKASGYNNTILKVDYSFKDSTGASLSSSPTDVGVYTVTATFSFKNPASEQYYLLPEPMTATLTVLPGNAQSIKPFKFEGVDAANHLSGYYYEGCEYQLLVGELPIGLEVTYTMVKIKDGNGVILTSPVTVPNDTETGIPVAREAGAYKVTASFTDTSGNYIPSSYPDMTATLTVENYPNQVLRYTPDIDGVIDDAYLASAHFTSTLNPTLSPEEYCLFTKISGNSSTGSFGAYATVYYLWDGDYVYVCIEVKDSSYYSRNNDYVTQPDPWKNDCIEFYYSIGGYTQPVTNSSKTIYPFYSAFTTDAQGRGEWDTAFAVPAIPAGKELTFANAAHISAVPAQRSAYFEDILCATTKTNVNVGEAYTYTNEMALPAKTETLRNGEFGEWIGNELIFKKPDKALTVGEFGYFCIQVNDLSDLPYDLGSAPATDKYISLENGIMSPEWHDYEAQVTSISSYSNRTLPEHFNTVQFSNTPFTEDLLSVSGKTYEMSSLKMKWVDGTPAQARQETVDTLKLLFSEYEDYFTDEAMLVALFEAVMEEVLFETIVSETMTFGEDGSFVVTTTEIIEEPVTETFEGTYTQDGCSLTIYGKEFEDFVSIFTDGDSVIMEMDFSEVLPGLNALIYYTAITE